MALIQSADGTGWVIDSTSNAGRITLYDINGNVISKTDKASITPGTSQGLPGIVDDYKTARLIKGMSDGSITTPLPTPLMYDNIEGAAVDTNKWIQTLTTMTITQAAGAITFNAGSSFATTVGAQQVSQMFFPIMARTRLIRRFKRKDSAHFNNNLIEGGFGAPASVTAASIGSGACWRKDGTGQYLPVLSMNGSETLGTAISNATFLASIPATDYAIFEVEVNETQAIFRIYTALGVLFNEQILDFTAATGNFTVTHLQAFDRTYNSAATGTAVQILLSNNAVFSLDFTSNQPFSHQMSGMTYGGLTSPTAYTTLTNWTNNVAPTTRTVSNTAAGEALLDGVISWANGANSFAASDTLDLVLFAVAIPSPYAFVCTGIRISTVNLGAANGAAIYTIQYGAAFGSSAVSLATAGAYPPLRKALGFQSLANAAAIGAGFDKDTIWNPATPITVQPGRFIHIMARVIGASAATASQVIRTSVTIDGYFK